MLFVLPVSSPDPMLNAANEIVVYTPLLSALMDEENPIAKATLGAIKAGHPWGDLGYPSDISGAAVFLASDAAQWVTGTSLVIDGGYTAQ